MDGQVPACGAELPFRARGQTLADCHHVPWRREVPGPALRCYNFATQSPAPERAGAQSSEARLAEFSYFCARTRRDVSARTTNSFLRHEVRQDQTIQTQDQRIRPAGGASASPRGSHSVTVSTVSVRPRPGRSPLVSDALLHDAVPQGWIRPPLSAEGEMPARKPVMKIREILADLQEDPADR